MTPKQIVWTRLIIGLVQGIIFCLIHESKSMDMGALIPVILIAWIVPVILMINIGNMRLRTLLGWAVFVSYLLIGLGYYDAIRGSDLSLSPFNHYRHAIPSGFLIIFVTIGMFIAQNLVQAAESEHRPIASYPRYFDVSWKLYVQLVFSFMFVGLMWLILFLGHEMFSLIGIKIVREILKQDIVAFPLSCMAFAYAIHATDARININGFRTMKLRLMSWLLPIIVCFATAFLLTLPFKGWDILWKTHHTSQIMLGAVAWLTILINSTYQDGAPENMPPKFLRYAGLAGAVVILPLVAIAAWAVMTRVDEYGWTSNLICVASCVLVAACYAIGYLIAALTGKGWLPALEKTNIYTSFVIVIVLLCLFTPIADPARLSVADQMRRLRDGTISPDKFDYAYLRRDGAKYGKEALQQLKDQAPTPEEKARIDRVMLMPALGSFGAGEKPPMPKPNELSTQISVKPAGKTLPESFIKQNWEDLRGKIPFCLFNNPANCTAAVIEQTADHPQEILLMDKNVNAMNAVFKQDGDKWELIGSVQAHYQCKNVDDAIHEGQFQLVPSSGQTLQVNGVSIPITTPVKCPQ